VVGPWRAAWGWHPVTNRGLVAMTRCAVNRYNADRSTTAPRLRATGARQNNGLGYHRGFGIHDLTLKRAGCGDYSHLCPSSKPPLRDDTEGPHRSWVEARDSGLIDITHTSHTRHTHARRMRKPNACPVRSLLSGVGGRSTTGETLHACGPATGHIRDDRHRERCARGAVVSIRRNVLGLPGGAHVQWVPPPEYLVP